MSSILSIVTNAYRATQEEQDDAVLWLSHALRNAGADVAVLLTASAVNYAVKKQDASGIVIGSIAIERPPQPNRDLLAMRKAGAAIFVVREELASRGISEDGIEDGFELISRSEIPAVLNRYEQIWHW